MFFPQKKEKDVALIVVVRRYLVSKRIAMLSEGFIFLDHF